MQLSILKISTFVQLKTTAYDKTGVAIRTIKILKINILVYIFL